MNKVRWGLIGCGDIARKRVARVLGDAPQSELVAVSRAHEQLAESFAKEFGAKKWFAKWRDLIDDPEINAVYVATPVNLHAEQTIAAAEAGKHVLCEKPMALNLAECDRMLAACRANDVKLGIAYYRHFYPAVQRIKSLIESGEIGVPIVVQVNSFEWFDPGPEHPRRWLLEKDVSGGGPMFDFGCHRIEVLLDIFGSVSKIAALQTNRFFHREVEDFATVLFQFDCGVSGVLTVAHSASEPQDTFDLFGSRGSLHVPVLNKGEIRVLTEAGERSESHTPAANTHQPLIADFIDALLNNREPVVGGEIGRAVAQVVAEIYAK
jgi:predicted dehydrogenase